MAERILNDILGDINDTIINTVSFGAKITPRKLCYLQEKDEKTFPLLNNGGRQGTKISWDDKYPLQIYHRILDLEKDVDDSKGYGAKPYEEYIYSMRLVGIGSKEKLGTTTYEDNQDYCKAVSDALPNAVLAGEYLETGEHEVIKQNVYDEEFAGVDHQKKLSLEGVAFWIDYTLRVNTCVVTPTAPTNLQASASLPTVVNLTWSGTGSSFGVERSLSSSGGFSQIGTSNGNSFTDSFAIANTTFYYRVRKLTPNSGYSNTASVTTPDSIAGPTNLTVSNPTSSTLDLSWTPNGFGDSQGIERSLTSGSGFSQITTVSAAATTYQDTGLSEGTTYYYRLRSLNPNSDYSDEANNTTSTTLDPDAEAWIDNINSYATLNLLPLLTGSQESAINDFVVSEKADGNWSLQDEFYCYAFGDAKGLVGSKGTISTAFGGLTWSSNGAVFNGSNAYIDSGYTASTDAVNMTVTDQLAGAFVYSDNDTSLTWFFATFNGANLRTGLTNGFANNIGYALNSAVSSGITDNYTFPGYNLIVRNSLEPNGINHIHRYQDGVFQESLNRASSQLLDLSLIVGSLGGSSSFFDGVISSFIVGASEGLDQTAHNTNVRQLLIDLGVSL